MKRIAKFLGLGFLMLAIFASSPKAEEKIKIDLDGKLIKSDVEPFIERGRTLVPLRVISESLGYEVKWNQEERIADISNNKDKLSVKIGSDKALLNDKEVSLDVAACLKNSRTFLPLRFVGESLGLNVSWDQESKTVFLKTGDKTKEFDTSNLSKDEKEYLEKIMDFRADLTQNFNKAKEALFEKADGLSKEDLIKTCDGIISDLEKNIQEKMNMANVPEKFKASHKKFLENAQEIAKILKEMKDSFMENRSDEAFKAFSRLTNFSIKMRDAYDRLKAEVQGLPYKAKEGIEIYEKSKENLSNDKIIDNLLKKIQDNNK